MTTDTVNLSAITLAGMWGATSYGVSADAVLVALVPCLLGAFGRVGFEIARASDPDNHVKWSNVLYLFGGTLISSPTISVLGLVLLQLTHAHSDPVAFFGLLFAGFVGPKSILWLTSTITGLVNKVTNLNLPKLGGPSDTEIKP